MLHPHTHLLLSGLVPFISARPFLETRQAGGIVGVATFNDYAHQSGGEVCSNAGINTTAGMIYYSIQRLYLEWSSLSDSHGSTSDNQGIYKAAAGDISPDLSSGLCDGSNADPNFQYDMSKW